MNTRKWMLVASVAVAIVALLILVPAALAQGPGTGNGPGDGAGPVVGGGFGPGSGMGPGNGTGPINGGRGGRLGGYANSLIAVAADTLGMDRTELVAELQSDKTIAQVAAEHNVSVETIVDAFVAPREERLADLVANGQITQEQADSVLATMKANVTARLSQPWSPKGIGPGTGFVDGNGDGVCDDASSGGPVGHQGRWGR
ncbi:MAG: hypothetical protein M5U01_07020 [Ardenticatenaceae bacterium]|nr:hypothetical protein [Ardenticatenaceae bacterium]